MGVAIRRADLQADRELLIDFMFRHLTPLSNARRFDWLYHKNPHGPAWAWIASDRASGEVAGIAAAFPRLMYVGGRPAACCVLGDFCLSPAYRSLGPAIQLQRACLAEVDSGKLALAYDFPSASMVAIYRRMGISITGQMVRFAKPLRADRRVQVVKFKPASRLVSAVGTALLAWRDAGWKEVPGVDTQALGEDFGEEFSQLAAEIRERFGACTVRSAEYLNWRYRAHPFLRYEAVAARRGRTLAGYAIFTRQENNAVIADLIASETAIIRALVMDIVRQLRAASVVTVSVPAMEHSPWIGVWRELGFHPRESCPVVTYAGKAGAGGRLCCCLLHGDRES